MEGLANIENHQNEKNSSLQMGQLNKSIAALAFRNILTWALRHY